MMLVDTAAQSKVAPVHVALILHALGPGGTERQVTHLTRGLVERGERVTVVEIRRGEHFGDEVSRAGGEVVSARARNRADVARVVRAIRAVRADVAYGLNPEANVLALASGVPAVFGVRTSQLDRLPHDRLARAAMGLQHRLAGRARMTIANSDAAAHELLAHGYLPDRVRVVRNGIAPQRTVDARRRDGQLIATAARIGEQKDPETFLRAAALGARPGRRFAWIGDGSLRNEVEQRTTELGVELLLPGVQRDMAAAYGAMGVFTLTSAWGEAFSNAFAEALACGLPCVVTDTGDHALARDVAAIVPPRDPAALAAAWDRATGGDGPAWVRTHMSVDQMVSSTHELLLDAARGR
jgi:glycosyltransferase involved in cell wall biosynthesis